MRAERFRLPEFKANRNSARGFESALQNRRTQPFDFVLTAERDMSRDQPELHWIESPADFFDPFGNGAGRKKRELKTDAHDDGIERAQVLRCLTTKSRNAPCDLGPQKSQFSWLTTRFRLTKFWQVRSAPSTIGRNESSSPRIRTTAIPIRHPSPTAL